MAVPKLTKSRASFSMIFMLILSTTIHVTVSISAGTSESESHEEEKHKIEAELKDEPVLPGCTIATETVPIYHYGSTDSAIIDYYQPDDPINVIGQTVGSCPIGTCAFYSTTRRGYVNANDIPIPKACPSAKNQDKALGINN